MKSDATQYGDKRRNKLIQAKEAVAMSEEQLSPAEPVSVILSTTGWIRSAKGHDIDGTTLSYRTGDEFLCQTRGKSNDQVYFLDSTGRSYSLLASTLPSARGHGEPLTSRVKPAAGANFIGMLMGTDEQMVLIASSAGYGFITKLENLLAKNKAGKTFLNCPEGSTALMPSFITNVDSQYIAAVTNDGHLLLFPVAELPELPKGKGNKMIAIPTANIKAHTEYCVGVAVLNEGQELILRSGKRNLTLKAKDLAAFQGERGRRGSLLPRGFRTIDGIGAA